MPGAISVNTLILGAKYSAKMAVKSASQLQDKEQTVLFFWHYLLQFITGKENAIRFSCIRRSGYDICRWQTGYLIRSTNVSGSVSNRDKVMDIFGIVFILWMILALDRKMPGSSCCLDGCGTVIMLSVVVAIWPYLLILLGIILLLGIVSAMCQNNLEKKGKVTATSKK